MPSTINGVGTHYYGKKNIERSAGVCEKCHNRGQLESYETRTWFCVIFIPIIPLGKKQILDYCPSCTTHRVMAFNQWQLVKNQAIQESAASFQADQDSPEAGLRMMQTLAAFKKTGEATKLAHLLREKHIDNAQVQFAVGGWLEHVGQSAAATECFENSYSLEPDEIAYKRAWGMTLADQGRLSDARDLLRELEPGHATYDGAVMFFLANQCQKIGDHVQALEIYSMLLEANPEFAKNKEFRTVVKSSEKFIGADRTMLPRKGVNRKLVGWLVAAVLLLAGAFAYSMYLGNSRELFILNGGKIPLTVQVDDQTVEVAPLGSAKISVAEGTHSYKVLKPQPWSENRGTFEMSTGFFSRLFASPAFVLDPARSSVLIWEEMTYAKQPANGTSKHELRVGESFVMYDRIDHLFEELPKQVRTKSESVKRTRLDRWIVEPENLTDIAATEITPEQKLQFTETHLHVDPLNSDLLLSYVRQADSTNSYERVYDFLAKGLDRRPLEIEWHRKYQGVSQRLGKADEMFKMYEAIVTANDQDSAALYLRGRIDPDSPTAESYFDRSIAIDPNNSFAWSAKCHRAVSIGEFADAKKFAVKAQLRRPDDYGIKLLMFKVRMALGEFDAMETEFKQALQVNALDMSAYCQLAAVYGNRGKFNEMQEAHNALELQLLTHDPTGQLDTVKHSDRSIDYAKGDHVSAEAVIRSMKQDPQRDVMLLACLLEQGAFDKITRDSLPNSTTQRGYLELYLYLGYKQLGDDAKSDEWYRWAMEDFASGDHETKRLAEIFKTAQGDELADRLFNLSMQGTERVVITLVAATRTAGETKQRLVQLVRKLNYMRSFPFYLVEKSLESI